MGIRLSEHESFFIRRNDLQEGNIESNSELFLSESEFLQYETVSSKLFNNSSYRFLFEKQDSHFQIKADYCIGIDWLGETGKYIYVEPKINSNSIQSFARELDTDVENEKHSEQVLEVNQQYELNYLKMLLQVTSVPESNLEIKNLVQIDWNSKHIEIEQKDDQLTPFLIIRFLQTLKSIVRKGLKKNYYKVQENLNNRVKGKILVGQHIKQNVFKNRFTSTYCEYQIFGEDHIENRFLKKVLQFVISYVENNKELLNQNYQIIQETINYCRPAFELISNDLKENEIKHLKHNPFYKDYKDALEIGSYILKKFAYNITKTSNSKVLTPPFWIDMPRLFELYVYSRMTESNSELKKEIHYQFSTYGNALDILVSSPNYQMVIDAKYKLKYKRGYLHEDIRQVAGYARLNKVRKKLNIEDDKTINCLIIYPDMENGIDDFSLDNIQQSKQEIKAYYKVFKLGVKLTYIGE